ncbi:MAG: aspartate aminotransferase family protein [Thaumarchaeota archaeon]|nr:aspartate aminotransferase family protein [Candidatus Calditenuaceae archaeon]MCX8203486.1 aspartate aminotransferase family protein [Nitrososphaeria archaeon]MDW8042930.1 aspartate aminotransferase family protein [Nitrososphaerota archaeon]
MNSQWPSLSKEQIFARLREYASEDAEPSSGRLFTIAFESGLDDLKEIALEAFRAFMDKNMLDFTEFPSVIRMERDVVGIATRLMNGDEQVAGTYTFGGTESVFLAVKAARDWFILGRGTITIPELVIPVTAHPCFDKAAEYMGLKVKRVKVDPETLQADVEAVKEAITENTAMVAASAPNWLFGTVDPVKEMAEVAQDGRIWFHVDACVGGFALPFMRKLGEDVPDFDFSVEGVTSISLDPHKYAYAPIGASVVLFRKEYYKMYSQFACLRWPGYPIVNPAVLSSRSAGHLASTWAVLHYLGEEGYLRLTRSIIEARDLISRGVEKLGYRVMGRPTVILAFTSEDLNLFRLSDEMTKRGWYLLPQRGVPEMGIPPSVHLTITPLNRRTCDEMVRDLEECTDLVRRLPPSEAEGLIEGLGLIMRLITPQEFDLASLGALMRELERSLEVYGPALLKALGLKEGLPKEMSTIYQLFNNLPPSVTELLVNYVVIQLFRGAGRPV